MTQVFLIVVRILLMALVGWWAYRLWIGTSSWTTRAVATLFCVVLAWQITGGTL